MGSRQGLSRLLHDVQSKTASLKSAAQLLKDSPPDEAREMLALMTAEARAILKCLYELRKELDADPEAR